MTEGLCMICMGCMAMLSADGWVSRVCIAIGASVKTSELAGPNRHSNV
jgi:hypothetical protein